MTTVVLGGIIVIGMMYLAGKGIHVVAAEAEMGKEIQQMKVQMPYQLS
jgi:hypothetical protein